MSRVLLWSLVIASLVLCLWAGRKYIAAREQATIAIRQLDVVRADVQAISAIRSGAPPESRRRRPAPGLAHRIADVVANAKLPQSALQSVSPETETSLAGTTLRKQMARITLDQLTLPQLGMFLARWREAEPVWTISSIDITPTRGRTKVDQDRPLHAVLEIETVFGDEPAQEGRR